MDLSLVVIKTRAQLCSIIMYSCVPTFDSNRIPIILCSLWVRVGVMVKTDAGQPGSRRFKACQSRKNLKYK